MDDGIGETPIELLISDSGKRMENSLLCSDPEVGDGIGGWNSVNRGQ